MIYYENIHIREENNINKLIVKYKNQHISMPILLNLICFPLDLDIFTTTLSFLIVLFIDWLYYYIFYMR